MRIIIVLSLVLTLLVSCEPGKNELSKGQSTYLDNYEKILYLNENKISFISNSHSFSFLVPELDYFNEPAQNESFVESNTILDNDFHYLTFSFNDKKFYCKTFWDIFSVYVDNEVIQNVLVIIGFDEANQTIIYLFYDTSGNSMNMGSLIILDGDFADTFGRGVVNYKDFEFNNDRVTGKFSLVIEVYHFTNVILETAKGEFYNIPKFNDNIVFFD